MTKMKLLLSIFAIILPTLLFADGNVGNIVRDVQGAPYAIFKCTTAAPILKWDTTLTPPRFSCQADSGSSGVYTTIQEEGVDLTARAKLNFIGAIVTCADDAGNSRTNCTVTSSADGVGYDEVLEEGSGLTKRAKINFIGSSITCVDNGGSTRTDCTLTDSTGYTTVADEGTNLTARATVNFIGNNISCVDNSGSTRTDCTIGTLSPQVPRRNCSTNVGTSSNHMVMTGCPFQNGSFTMTSVGNNPARVLTDYTFSLVATTAANNNQAYWESRSTNLGPSFRHRLTMRAIIDVTDSAGTDSTKYRFYASLIETQAGTGPIGLTACQTGATWNGGGSWDAAWICWEKNVQANIMVCGGETSSTTIHCTDTGIAAPASDTKVDLFLDHRDGSKITGSVNGVAFSADETTKLPATSSNSQIATMIGITNTAVPSGASAIIIRAYLFEYSWQ